MCAWAIKCSANCVQVNSATWYPIITPESPGLRSTTYLRLTMSLGGALSGKEDHVEKVEGSGDWSTPKAIYPIIPMEWLRDCWMTYEYEPHCWIWQPHWNLKAKNITDIKDKKNHWEAQLWKRNLTVKDSLHNQHIPVKASGTEILFLWHSSETSKTPHGVPWNQLWKNHFQANLMILDSDEHCSTADNSHRWSGSGHITFIHENALLEKHSLY